MRVPSLVLALLLAAAPAAAGDLWWIFLTKGPNRAETDREVLAGQQKEHIGNLERLWNAGIAHLAGPLGEDGFIRGIVVLSAASREEVMRHFEPDPFVRGGRLALEAMRWSGSVEKLGRPTEPPGLQPCTLVIVGKGPAWTAGAALDPALLERLAAGGDLVLAGNVEDAGDRVAVLLFRDPDAAAVTARLAADPAVAGRRLVLEPHPQLVGRGMLDAQPAARPDATR